MVEATATNVATQTSKLPPKLRSAANCSANCAMAVKTAISRICLEPGSTIRIPDVDWAEFELILQELGEARGSRIAYSQNTLEITVLSPNHERSKILISDIVKILLRAQGRDWESLGATTFRRQIKTAGLEPDDCFYSFGHLARIYFIY